MAPEEDECVFNMFNLVGFNKCCAEPIYATIQVNGKELQMEVDTGASASVISQATYHSLWHSGGAPALQATEISLRQYTGECIPLLGAIEAHAAYQGQEAAATLLVVKGEGPSLLGRDLLQKSRLNWREIRYVTVIAELLGKYADVFKNESGTLRGTTVKLCVDPFARPRFFKPRTVPYAMKAKVEAELERLQQIGVIEPIEFSDWAAPIVPVLKEDGGVRICGDYKLTVNQASQLDAYPLPRVDDLFATLAGGRTFTKLDMSHAYQQLLLDEESKKYVTINTHKGLFKYNRLVFGVASSPAIFQRTMDNLLQNIPGVAVYLDDILVTGKTEEEHLRNLEQVLKKLSEAGLRLKHSKCVFQAPSVTYLGHRISAQGLSPLEEKVRAVKEAPSPKNVAELRSFLGLVNYYGKFLPDLSSMLAPLDGLLHKDSQWRWSQAQEKAFRQVKELLQSAPLLVHFDPEKEVLLSCDASPYGIGAVLSHRMEEGEEKPVGYASRTLTAAEKGYSQLEKEGLAIVFAVKRFHQYLYGRPFTVVTDHKPLLSLFSETKGIPPMASARVQRWALTLSAYQYRIVYKAGPENANADAFSRLPLPEVPDQSNLPPETVFLLDRLANSPVCAKNIKAWTEQDPELSQVKQWLLQGWPATVEQDQLKPYAKRQQELSVQDGCILWGSRVIVPPPGQSQIIEVLREAHPGISRMKSLARSFVWWPGMDSALEDKEAHKKDEKLLEFPLKLSHIQAAARISLETLDAELHLLTSRTHSVEESIQRDTELLQQLDSFLQHATSSLCSLRGSRQQLKREGSELIDFFCEDRDTFRLDDCFSIFHTFCSRFTNAVKENMEREAKEATRRQRIQELEEKKRHSWAGGEKVDGVFGLRCHSELDMSTALSRHDEAGLLMELLTPRSHPRSPVNNSHSPLGRAVSLRRSRKSPSCSPSIAAEQELSTFLEKATDRKNIQQRGKGSSFPSPSSPGFPVSTQTAPQNSSSPSKRSPKNKNHATATYLSQNATQTCANATNPANELAVKPTSDSNQQSEHNNKSSSDQPGMGLSSHATLTTSKPKDVELVLTQQTDCTDKSFQQSTTATRNMVVVLDKCTLVPELKVFGSGNTLTSHSENRHVGLHQDDVTITDLEEEKGDDLQVDKVHNNGQLIVNPKQSDEQVCELSSSSTPREGDEGQEDKVVVWCVTGVCEATSDTQSTYAETEKDQHKGDNQGGNKQTSSALANDMPSEPQPANEKPVPVPISSQPVPVPRCDDTSLLVSSSVWRLKEPPTPNVVPALTADASEKDKELEEEEEVSTNRNSDGATVSKQSTEEKSKNNMASKDSTSKTAKAASSTKVKAEPATPSKLPSKSLPTSNVQTNGKKPTPNTISASGKSKSIRTFTTSENKDMRRVVPISRTNRSPSRIKHTEKNRGSSSTAVPTSLTPSKRSSASPRRVARPANAPSSRQSGTPKTLGPKDSKNQNVSGTQPSAREQNKDFQGKMSSQKPLMKPKAQQEEKICRSTLRALSQGGRSGAGGSVSAPATPLRKATSSSSSVFPGFARSTASSSFRRTHTNLAVPAASHSPNIGSDPSPKPSSKTSSPVTPSSTSLPITLSRSLRVHASARSSDVQKLSPSSQRKSQSVKSSPRASRHDLLAPPKGHRRNDSDSDKSAHSQDSVLPTRPRWR
ncbi:uncharacterized protein LOC120718450 [Simochromis diagramma]|uniref:uncharacterized protein LOC120718450 n=1 Tax=Simochromis diagramma TaxID=43689 RepID=UPI001A7EA8C9|nr:uncharacterized protein LOC120718450 [Simochromis diagramma]